ncbi:hypothetical protein [Streptomyces europaeiscabiei]|uniref:Secreted protein n=1 Tax=Streptomyces europaeiscabiei TaxID=146819 RepID=A0ABU4NPZ1_9ACTN|nr:hypothetical protein [Streptomyces europaeiscabiei]MDX2530929.1 hypothetical protein [Streptomyces europaeiscabiei]MDX2761353.1 hypothetical protein [Streptomyces europaeiscabiei]MDX2767547.1 hypothetical protein [Streptomyces europaeiscabiei]MDX3547615.1 hypothetical protein [Streptomyces europaeiscabiei]MDX3557092.1 hypothetical protein [Streptomyces europaeiscabiei]
MRFRWLFATAGLAAAIGTTVASPSASAASGCWSHADGNKYWCENVSGAPVYGSIGNSRLYPNPNAVVGTMYSNPSWFYCKLDGQAHVGGPHPTRWLRTVADNGQYGWMKDTAIYSETDPVRDCYPS